MTPWFRIMRENSNARDSPRCSPRPSSSRAGALSKAEALGGQEEGEEGSSYLDGHDMGIRGT